jgi:hypothetical protein
MRALAIEGALAGAVHSLGDAAGDMVAVLGVASSIVPMVLGLEACSCSSRSPESRRRRPSPLVW